MSLGNTEILQIAEAVAREKGIQRDSVIQAMEQAVQAAARKKYGHEHNIKAEIDKKTGEIKLFRVLEIVELVEDYIKHISLSDAVKQNSEAELGGEIYDPLPPIDLGRVAANIAKHVITTEVTAAENDRIFREYEKRPGEIINGIVKRIEYGNVTVDLGRAEAILERRGMIPNETFRQNDRVRAYIFEVKRQNKGPQIYLSRSCNEFLAKLFAQEVPEIYDNVIEVKSVAREPGSRAKMAVYSRDSSIDPVGSCVGVRGSRVQAVMNELQGEKIDIIQWSSEPATFVVNALAPAEVSKVVIDEDKKRIEVVVPSDQLSLAIGRRGQNVRLASQLTGWNIDVLTEDEESKRRVDEFNNISQLFVKALDVEEVLAQLLAAEGFSTIEEIAYIDLEELASIEGFDENLANELQSRAINYLDSKANAEKTKLTNLGFQDELAEFVHLPISVMIKMAEAKINTIEDLADLSALELRDIVTKAELADEDLNNLIMAARAQINN